MASTRSSSNSSNSTSWCTIESDPGVFTELISQIGVQDVQVEELYALDLDAMKQIEPIYGLVFLFKWRSGEKDDRNTVDIPDLFFASQVINNACATQAILSILLNTTDIKLGEELTQFKEFTKDFSADLRGQSISNSELIRTTHNSFARPEPFLMSGEKATDDEGSEDVYHFISYVPFGDSVFELDGLKKGPIHLGKVDKNQSWLEIVIPIIQQRIEKYSKSEIRFNLMAIIKNRVTVYNEQIDKLQKLKEQCEAKLAGGEQVLEIDSSLPATPEELKAKKTSIEKEIANLKQKTEFEEEKFNNWKVENVRRKHNYIPFFVNLLKILADQGQLGPLVAAAQRKV
eukprot:TRINITY_DN2478_c0_g1_i1.p1 TRINITY_DN2478_c0_g1~~TRINITY_DN2478_c0_g1_i1.p1  ORF type:complete len:358 (+),score=144.12 TRINITY_DN2478_c0_g1_i1:45-1076(+)